MFGISKEISYQVVLNQTNIVQGVCRRLEIIFRYFLAFDITVIRRTKIIITNPNI